MISHERRHVIPWCKWQLLFQVLEVATSPSPHFVGLMCGRDQGTPTKLCFNANTAHTRDITSPRQKYIKITCTSVTSCASTFSPHGTSTSIPRTRSNKSVLRGNLPPCCIKTLYDQRDVQKCLRGADNADSAGSSNQNNEHLM